MTAPGHTSSAPALATSPITIPARTLQPARRPRHFQAHPVQRRIVYVAGYEGLSVLFTVAVMSGMLGHGGGQSTLTAVLLSTAATVWNYLWNTLFEACERRIGATGRGVASRVVHALGYEGGVLLVTIPLVSLMLGVSLVEAAMLEGGLLVFFLVFTTLYAALFDRVFGLPASARARE